MMSDDQILEVVQAHKEGRKLEWRHKGEDRWWTCSPRFGWRFDVVEYRVARDSREPREWDVHVTKHGQIIGYSPLFPDECNKIKVREVLENEPQHFAPLSPDIEEAIRKHKS